MGHNILITVVLPLYNKAHTIINTLTSVVTQTYGNFEIIIIDDGSTDNGAEIISQNFHDSRIRIISQSNTGVSAARNRGVAEAIGEYIAFIDGDDEWHPEYLEHIRKGIALYPEAGMLCTGGVGTSILSPRISYSIAKKYINHITKLNFFENPAALSHTSRTVVKKEVFLNAGGFPIKMKCCEDYALTQKIGLISEFVYIGLPLAKYIGGVPGQITSADQETRYTLLDSVVEYYNHVMNFSQDKPNNKLFKIYFRYDIRHRIKGLLKQEPKWFNKFYYGLNEENKALLNPIEKKIYTHHWNKISSCWINISKVIWRMRFYPIVGEQIDINTIPQKYRIW